MIFSRVWSIFLNAGFKQAFSISFLPSRRQWGILTFFDEHQAPSTRHQALTGRSASAFLFCFFLTPTLAKGVA
jgi:hypothetical protein